MALISNELHDACLEMKGAPFGTVDIIAACRNSSKYLCEMIESVLHQDYPNTKLFIQDGASTDATPEVIRRYAIRWASEPDNGISQALNKAIRATHGEIIGFTSADDSLRTGAVTAAVEVFRNKPECVMVYGDCQLIDPEGRPFKIWKSREFDIDRLLWENFIPFQTVYVRRNALTALGGFDENLKVAQDFDLWLRICARFSPQSIAYLPRLQGDYRIRPKSVGFSNLALAGRCHEIAVWRFLDDPAGNAMVKYGIKKAKAGALLQSAYLYMLGRESVQSWKTIMRAIRMWLPIVATKHGLWTLVQIFGGVRVWKLRKHMQIKIGISRMNR